MVEQGIWRIRSNQKLWGIYKDLDTVADIKKKRLERIGHVVRMNQGRAVTKIFEGKPEESRRRERPRLRWLEDVEKELLDMKFMRW